MNKILSRVEIFKIQLQELDVDYICATPLPDSAAFISFLGPFQGALVQWNMTLSTLAHHQKTELSLTSESRPVLIARPFIEIKQENLGVFEVKVVLDLKIIDATVIRKSIIMMRNYKRLKIGKIEFGNSAA